MSHCFQQQKQKPKGFTLLELMVASLIFLLAMGIITSVSVSLYRGYRRQIAQDRLYEESRILLDRLSREARVNTIDYDEYFNQRLISEGGLLATVADQYKEYGANYREYYYRFFYIDPPTNSIDCVQYGLSDPNRYLYAETDLCRDQHVNEGFYSTKANDSILDDDKTFSALGGTIANPDYEKDELYLISPDGKQKTIIKLDEPNTGQIGILVLDLQDKYNNENMTTEIQDGYYDSWTNNVDFPITTSSPLGFVPISPASIAVTDLRFFVSPIDDPRKEFNANSSADPTNEAKVQAHPNVTIIMTAEVAPFVARRFLATGNEAPNITIQTTISSRVYDNVIIPFETN